MATAKGGDRTWIVVLLAVLGTMIVPRAGMIGGSRAPVAPGAAAPALVEVAPREVEKAAAAPALDAECAPDPKLARALRDAASLPAISDAPADLAAQFRRRRGRLETLVVAVPDPRQSHMALYFDQAIEALRSGAARLGFAPDRFVLPWSGQGDPRKGEEGANAAEEPGLMLFQREDALLAVVLVTESPVLGSSPTQLCRAFRLARELDTERSPLVVLGPFFSGATRALSLGLERAATQRPDFAARVVSGTATSKEALRLGELPFVEFQRTVAGDDELVRFVLRRIWERHRFREPRIALITEIGTQFGSASSELGAPPGVRLSSLRRSGEPEFFARFAFPLHVSDVRVARERQHKAAETSASELRRTLGLRLDPEEERALDTPASLSDLTPYEQELALGQQLTRICRDQIQYLVVAATDPVDVVFLAQEARKYCPGITLVTLGSEVLFSHPDLRAAFTGTLVASSYPLLYATRAWTSPGLPQPFPNQVSEGFYNAFVALAEVRGLVRGAAPLSQYQPFSGEKGCPAAGPQLWLTMVANGAFWPLSLGCAREGPLYAPSPPALEAQRIAPIRATGVARGVAGLVLFALMLHVTALVFAARRVTQEFPLVRWFAPVRPPRRHAQLRYLAGAHLALVALAVLMLPSAFYVSRTDRALPWFQHAFELGTRVGLVLTSVLAGVLLATWLALLFPASLRERIRRRRLSAQRWAPRHAGRFHARLMALFATAIMAWLICAVVRYELDFLELAPIESLLALTRVLDPLGMSPLAPAFYLAAGFYVWSLCGLRRIQSLERFSQRAPIPADPDEPGAPPRSLQSPLGVVRALRGIWSGSLWPVELAVLALFFLPGLYFWLRVLPTFEGRAYDSLFKAAFIVLYGAVVLAFVHFVLLSRLLVRFLHQLAAHPMADAYDRIAVKVKSSFGLQFEARVPAAEELAVSAYSGEALSRLCEASASLGAERPEIEAALARQRPRVAECSARVTRALAELKHDSADATAESRTHEAFFLYSRQLFRTLRGLWELRSGRPDTAKVRAAVRVEELLPAGGRANVPTAALFMAAVPEDVYLWMRMAEDFVAMRVATFIHHLLYQLRNLLTFALVGALLLVLAVASYPVQPFRFVTVFAWSLVLVVVLAGFGLIVRLERNEVLSRLGGSTPGRIDFNLGFVSQIFVYVVLPLAAVVSSIFPEVGDALFSWVGTLQRLLP